MTRIEQDSLPPSPSPALISLDFHFLYRAKGSTNFFASFSHVGYRKCLQRKIGARTKKCLCFPPIPASVTKHTRAARSPSLQRPFVHPRGAAIELPTLLAVQRAAPKTLFSKKIRASKRRFFPFEELEIAPYVIFSDVRNAERRKERERNFHFEEIRPKLKFERARRAKERERVFPPRRTQGINIWKLLRVKSEAKPPALEDIGNQSPKNGVYHISAPDFVSSLEDEDSVYFFFRENAVEHINCGKVSGGNRRRRLLMGGHLFHFYGHLMRMFLPRLR